MSALQSRRASRLALAVGTLLTAVVASLAPAGAAEPSRAWTLYLQQAFPKQTNTNAQIDEINATFGSDFDTWDEVVNLSLGSQLFWPAGERWQLGVELDYSRGGIDGTATVPTEAGPAELAFEQQYSIFANALFVAHWLPCGACETVVPFVLGGVGVGYEKDRTTLTLRNAYLDEALRVDNDGWFPVTTVGAGLDWHAFGTSPWYLQIGAAYYWGRLDHTVAAAGSLAPAPRVRADNDTSGPNWWLGVGRRF